VDRDVREDPDGSIHTVDETGYAIAFAVKDAVDVEFEARSVNVTGNVYRWNEELTAYGRARPIRVCHLAMDIPKEGREKATEFYVQRLSFRPVDIVMKLGSFLQAEGDWDQHNFLMMHRCDCYGINHAAYECRNFDEVIEGGNHMISGGWTEARYVGRHALGSNVYRFFYAPTDGRVEYVCDMTRVERRAPDGRRARDRPVEVRWPQFDIRADDAVRFPVTVAEVRRRSTGNAIRP
jgi:hypothetical protein